MTRRRVDEKSEVKGKNRKTTMGHLPDGLQKEVSALNLADLAKLGQCQALAVDSLRKRLSRISNTNDTHLGTMAL